MVARSLIMFVLRSIRDTQQPVFKYVLKAALISVIPSVLISSALHLALPNSLPSTGTFAQPFVALAINPCMETLVMWPILSILSTLFSKPIHAALGSAAIWAMAHSILAPTLGWIIAWPFFVFSMVFVEWKKRSIAMALLVTALTHSVHNLIPVIAFVACQQ